MIETIKKTIIVVLTLAVLFLAGGIIIGQLTYCDEDCQLMRDTINKMNYETDFFNKHGYFPN